MDKAQTKIKLKETDWIVQQEVMDEYGKSEYYEYKVMAIPLNLVQELQQEVAADSESEAETIELAEKHRSNETYYNEYRFLFLPNGTFVLIYGDLKLLRAAKQIGIVKIQSQVIILLPHRKLLSTTITSLEKMTLQQTDYLDRIDELNLECRLSYKDDGDIPPFIKKIRTELYDNLSWVKDKRNFLLHNEAKRLELLPDRPRLKIVIKKQGN